MRVQALKNFRGAPDEPFLVLTGQILDMHPARAEALRKKRLVADVPTPHGAPTPPDPQAPASAFLCERCHRADFLTEERLLEHQKTCHGFDAGRGPGVVFKSSKRQQKATE